MMNPDTIRYYEATGGIEDLTQDEISDYEEKYWQIEDAIYADPDSACNSLFFARIMGGPRYYAKKVRELAIEFFERDYPVYVYFKNQQPVITDCL
jgi:hypothetical protein